MGVCDKCGYQTEEGYDYYKDKDSGVVLCEDCYSSVDHELMDLLGHEFSAIEAGFDDLGVATDYNEY